MRIIDLLNKIANGEEVPKTFIYDNYIFNLGDDRRYRDDEDDYLSDSIRYDFEDLNEEIEIIEDKKEDKKIRKIPYYSLEKIQKAKNKEQWYEERISLLEERIENQHEKINEIIDKLNKEE